MSLPPFLPPVSAIFVASDHSVWIRHEEHDGSGAVEYSVLSPEGEPLGIAHVPANVTLLESDGRKVWGRLVDDNGVNFVIRYDIDRR